MHPSMTLHGATPLADTDSPRLKLELASSGHQIEEAQRLRWRVFAEELGARLVGDGLDKDEFDPWCDHLLVRDLATEKVVGTYRILAPHQARLLGRCYTETEFDLRPLAALRAGMVELGRSCVHPDYRKGSVINLLWAGLARYMRAGGYAYLIGCPSISLADGGHNAAGIYKTLAGTHLSPPEYRVVPHCRLPLEAFAPPTAPLLPPLIKGYVRLGAWICGEPAWDPDFNTADLPMLLPMARIEPRYLHWLLDRAAS